MMLVDRRRTDLLLYRVCLGHDSPFIYRLLEPGPIGQYRKSTGPTSWSPRPYHWFTSPGKDLISIHPM